MFATFFQGLRDAGVPVTLREYLTLLEALEAGAHDLTVDGFYWLSRAALVKDERYYDRFDRCFGHHFRGLDLDLSDLRREIPKEWLRQLAELYLTEEEMRRIQAMGGFEELMSELERRLKEQRERHQGGSKWIGTGGTSPFGAWGFNPFGVRIGQDRSRHRRATKVWDRREYRNLDGSVEIGTRNMKVALRRLREFVREGAAEELDLPGTIGATARNAGHLDLKLVPERRNRAKVLLFLDAGGSMDDHVRVVEQLFSAARSEFKHLEHYYFHNCVYERVWRDNARRHEEARPTWDVIHTYGRDYRLIFVGDASMSPYELVAPGGAVEHWNEEPGHVWVERLLEAYPRAAWINPVQENAWGYVQSVGMLRTLMDDRMYPLTLEGLDRAMRGLTGPAAGRSR